MSGTVSSALPLWLVLIPALFGALVLILPGKVKSGGLIGVFAGAAGALAVALSQLGQSLEFTRAWAGWNMDFSLKLNPANAPLVIAAAVLTLVVTAWAGISGTYPAKSKVFMASMLFALAMASGALMANNLVAMLFFWQAMWAPVFGMIQAGGENAWKTSIKAVFTAGASDLMMILGIGFASLSAESMTMDVMRVPATALGSMGFLLMAVGAIGKLGAIPFHGWLYAASEDAPAPFMGLIPGGLNLLLGVNLVSKFPGMFDAGSGAMLLVLIAGAGTVVLAGMLSMSAGGFKRLAIALNIAQAGALVLGSTSVAGGAFAFAAIVSAAAGCCLYLSASQLEKESSDKSQLASFAFYVSSGAAVAVTFTGALYRIALFESWLSLILSVVALIGAIFAVSGVTGLIRAGRDGEKPVPSFDLGRAQSWLDRTRCDPYPAARAAFKGYAKVSLTVNDAISWFYDVGVVWFVGFLSGLVKKAHNGSQSRYVLWVLAGAVVVIAIFALS
jgi:formate hydrogenlyase subunit 3/multisubunit Na+/H+ antiporter MnhD subunit